MPTKNIFDQFDEENPFDIFDEDYAGPLHKAAEPPSFLEEQVSKLKSGYQKGRGFIDDTLTNLMPEVVPDAVSRGLGYEDSAARERAQRAQMMEERRRKAAAIEREHPDTTAGRERIAAANETGNTFEIAKTIAGEPRAVASTISESLGMVGPSMVAAGATGGALMPLMVGLGSGSVEYGSTLQDTMAESGVDLDDATEIRRALEDPKLMARAKERAAKRGIAVGAFDALTAGLAGRLLAGSRGAASAAGRVGGEIGVQAGGGMAGETAAQLLTDRRITSQADILMEGFAEIPTALAEAPSNYRTSRQRYLNREADARSTDAIQSEYTSLAENYGAIITSRDRTPEKNRKVGGVANSQHLTGTAGDFVVPPERKAEFIADAERRGYEAIDEGDHIHLELPKGIRPRQHTVIDDRKAQRRRLVESGNMAPGVAAAEDALDEARDRRGMPLDQPGRTVSPATTPAPATPTQQPQAPLVERPVRSAEDLIAERERLLAIARDPAAPPAERRTAKQQSQYLIEEIKNAPKRIEIERQTQTALDELTSQYQAPAIEPQPVPEAQPVAAPFEPVAAPPAPEPVQPPIAEAPQAPSPLTTPLPTVAKPLQIEVAEESAETPFAGVVMNMLNRNESMRRMLRTSPSDTTISSDNSPLRNGDVVQVLLKPNQQRSVEGLSKLLGPKIIMYDVKLPGYAALGGFAVDDRHIFVSPRALKKTGMPLNAVIGHEFLHTLRRSKNPALEQLIEHAKAQINLDARYTRKTANLYRDLWESRGYDGAQKLDNLTEEMVADLVGDLINDEAFWNELEQSDPGLFRKLIKQFITFLSKLANRAKLLDDESAFNDIESLRDKARAILADHIARQQQDNAPAKPKPAAEVKPKLGEDYRKDLVKARAEQMSASYLERGQFMSAARESARASDTFAKPVEIDTPEKRKFFKDASPQVARKDKAAVMFHGTAGDITSFKPKTGEGVFLSPQSDFAAPYAAASMEWYKREGSRDVIIDGESMRQRKKEYPPTSVEFIIADMLLAVEGNVGEAIQALKDFGYVIEGTEHFLDGIETAEVIDELENLQQMAEADPSVMRLGEKNEGRNGMQIMPLVTNVKNPFDFENKTHVKRMMEELRDLHQTPKQMVQAMRHRHAYQTWDEVQRDIQNGSWTLIEDTGAGIPRLIREMGFDGYFVQEEGVKNLSVFDPKQIKSATGNVGSFGVREPTPEEAASLGLTVDEAIALQDMGDIRLKLFGPAFHQALNGGIRQALDDATIETRAAFERRIIDEYRDVREVQKIVADTVFGGALPADMNPHRQENLRHGAYQDARERAEERFIAPIARVLSRAGLTQQQFSDYLWWRHAPERDAYLRKNLDPNLAASVGPADLAGIDPKDALANIAALPPATRKAFERAAKFVDGMRHFTLKSLLDSGQITQEHHDNVLKQYRFYVPFRGMPNGEDVLNGRPGGARGMSMSARALGKRATGRKSKPDDIMEEMMRDMDNALIGVQKQKVLAALVRLIIAHPDPDLWSLSPVSAERKWVDGQIMVVANKGDSAKQITFMHHGLPVKIEIEHAGMRNALLNLDQDNIPNWMRRLGAITRYLSMIKTALSPYFLLVNPVRDGGFAASAVASEHGAKAVADVARFYPHTYGVLKRDYNRKAAPHKDPTVRKLQQYAREFASTGGKTGYTYVNDIRQQQRKMKNLMARHADSPGLKNIVQGGLLSKDGALLARKMWQHAAHAAEIANDMAENSTRLAVFAAMREKGMSPEDAAAYVKEVTVNFNRRGSWSKYVGGLYMFFNAAVQGSTRLIKLMGNKKFAGTMVGAMGASYALALIQMFAAGDDDDGESLYEKAISDSQAQRTVGFYLGDGKSIAIPVPYGPNIFTYMGYRIAKFHYDTVTGKQPGVGKAVGDIMGQMATSMSPIDPGKGLAGLLPEIAKIPARIATNTNDFGGKISPRMDTYDQTGNPRFYETDVKTGQLYRIMAKGINYATGGNAYEGGLFNLTGEHARYLTDQATGGLGRLATESYELAELLWSGIDVAPSDIPLSNVYYRGRGPQQHAGTYFDNLDDYNDTVADWERAIANNDTAKLDEIAKKAPWVEGAELDASTKEGKAAQAGSLMQSKRDIDREMKALRKEKDAILGDPALSRREKKQQAYAIDQQIAELQQDFNFEFNAARRP